MTLSKTQIVRLSKYDQMLIQTALTRKAPNPPSDKLKDLQSIYRDITGSSRECFSCTKNWLIRMAKWYVSSSTTTTNTTNSDTSTNESNGTSNDTLKNGLNGTNPSSTHPPKKTPKSRKPRSRKADTPNLGTKTKTKVK